VLKSHDQKGPEVPQMRFQMPILGIKMGENIRREEIRKDYKTET
jgi:hypothetical protein